MPIYGYRCGECDHELEVLQSMSADPLRECPECGGSLRKLLYPVGVQFKGSGFYSTDYKNGGPGEKSASGTSDAAGGSSPEKKADATSEKKAKPSSEKKSEPVASKE